MPMPDETKMRNWFALYTKPRHEFKAQAELQANAIDLYLPTIAKIKKWSDRKKKIIEPVFKGYIFIYTDEKERLLALQSKTIVRTVSFNGKPSIIPEWEIENLKKFLSENPEVFISDKIEIGTKVKIVSGPFADVIGVVKEYNKETWLAVSVDMIQRSILVRLPRESVLKIMES
jgi:transcriptional antiterminator RfaH